MDFQKIVENLGHGIICVDSLDQVRYINPVAEELLGVNRKWIEEKKPSVHDIFPVRTDTETLILSPILQRVREENIEAGLKSNTFVSLKQGLRQYVSASITGVEIENEIYCVISFRDITRIKESELAMIYQKKHFETVFNALPVGVLLMDENYKIVRANSFIKKRFKMERQEKDISLGKFLRCPYLENEECDQREECMACELRKAIEESSDNESQKIVRFEHAIDEGDRVICDYEIGIIKHYDEKNQSLIMLKDITNFRKEEVKLKKEHKKALTDSKIKSAFIRNMSHEIRTPINGIIGMIDLTRRKMLEAELMENLEIAKQSAENLLFMMDNLLDLTRLQRNELNIHPKLFMIEEIGQDIQKAYAWKASDKGLNLFLDLEECQGKSFCGDMGRIEQILFNLIDNGVKFTRRGHVKAVFSLKEEEGKRYLSVAVSDTGIGISQEDKIQIFSTFLQVDDTYTREYGGVGIGLALSRKLAKRMKGSLTFESQEGLGSSFFMEIPESDVEEKDAIKPVKKQEVILNEKRQSQKL